MKLKSIIFLICISYLIGIILNLEFYIFAFFLIIGLPMPFFVAYYSFNYYFFYNFEIDRKNLKLITLLGIIYNVMLLGLIYLFLNDPSIVVIKICSYFYPQFFIIINLLLLVICRIKLNKSIC